MALHQTGRIKRVDLVRMEAVGMERRVTHPAHLAVDYQASLAALHECLQDHRHRVVHTREPSSSLAVVVEAQPMHGEGVQGED